MAGLAYGKKAGCVYPILFGAALMFYPYFISQTWLLYAIGVALTAMLVQFRDR
jgi:predicted phage tail protein